jgi:hypothetical protein
MVVRQSYQVHRKIAALLRDIRAVAAKKSGGSDPPRRDPSSAPIGVVS